MRPATNWPSWSSAASPSGSDWSDEGKIMTPVAVIGFWAAVMGGVLMYLVAGREIAEALRELFGGRKAPEKDAFEGERARLGHLATAFLGSGVDVVAGEGVTVENGSGRAVRIALPASAGP